MAGFRTFATGEVLTAANVNNFLMKQSVMVFADAAARTTALGAEVVEGMLTYNEDTAQLEVFDGAAFVLAAPAPPAGIGPNVVQTVKTDTFTTSSTSFVDVTDLDVTITLTSATSKVLLLADVAIAATGNRFRLQVTDASNTIIFSGNRIAEDATASSASMNRTGFVALLSPATTSPVTFKVRLATDTSTSFVNRSDNGAITGSSTITAIEVAA